MKILTSVHPHWLTNCYLICGKKGQGALLIDAGAPVAAFEKELKARQTPLAAILITHNHFDHIEHLASWRRRFPCPVYFHHQSPLLGALQAIPIGDNASFEAAGMKVRTLYTPGHTSDHLSFLINDKMLFTGDLLFKGSVGGTAEGTFAELRRSIMDRVMPLSHSIKLYPGHGDLTSIGQEWQTNPFISAWRSPTLPTGSACTIRGQAGQILLIAKDYDGEEKAWVRINGQDQIIPWPDSG